MRGGGGGVEVDKVETGAFNFLVYEVQIYCIIIHLNFSSIDEVWQSKY